MMMLSVILMAMFSNSPFAWLAGTWTGKTSEVWQLHQDGSLTSVAFVQKGNEKQIYETVRFAKRDTAWYYTPTTIGQNGGNPVDFKVVEMSDKHFVAENLQHDFPQRIGYTLVDSKHLTAFIEGPSPKDGKWKRIDFEFTAGGQSSK